MVAAAMGGPEFRWPVGTYVNNDRFSHIVMAMETTVSADGVKVKPINGTPEEEAELEKSYKHLCALPSPFTIKQTEPLSILPLVPASPRNCLSLPSLRK